MYLRSSRLLFGARLSISSAPRAPEPGTRALSDPRGCRGAIEPPAGCTLSIPSEFHLILNDSLVFCSAKAQHTSSLAELQLYRRQRLRDAIALPPAGRSAVVTRSQSIHSREHYASAGPLIFRLAATLALVLLICAQGIGEAEAKTKKQCHREAAARDKNCTSYGNPNNCSAQNAATFLRCMCAAGDEGSCKEIIANSPRSPDVPPANVKPKGPTGVGTPPKSNPITPTKPKSPGIVTEPKSNSSSGGPVLRSGGSQR